MYGGIYWRDTGRKIKLRDRARVYRQRIQQSQYKQLKVKGHLRASGHGEFQIFTSLQMRSQHTNFRRSYEARF